MNTNETQSPGSLHPVVRRIRDLAKDHAPDGWPAVRMSELTEMADALEHLEKMNRFHCRDWAESHTHAQNVAKDLGVPSEMVDGDSYGVPGIEELVDMIAARVNPPNDQAHPTADGGTGGAQKKA